MAVSCPVERGQVVYWFLSQTQKSDYAAARVVSVDGLFVEAIELAIYTLDGRRSQRFSMLENTGMARVPFQRILSAKPRRA